ncbi:YlxR family protein [Klugiella xanthotipulae]|uniref:YlxR domain-containing protein n=1 Tax=Klugiella xanthotipulae TaxID=244735 RepID=A0A543I4J0_9MICO|nr:YlxR family protein [Klugiella xanthotipulae]TQM65516.1 hypothetical protein FB466_0320 [Klugiella xanthotipulae]
MDPVRTCIGCRSRVEKSVLLRIVSRNSQVAVDEKAVLPGRGAWLHPSRACFDTAVQRRAFARAFRVSGPLDTQPLENRLKRLMEN